MNRAQRAKGVVMANRLLVASLLCGAASLASSCSERVATSIRTAQPEERNLLLRQAIRDAGYLCDEVVDATTPSETAIGWRVLCADMLVYLASLDTEDALHVEPIAYGDPATSLPISRDPEAGPETVHPDP